MLNLQLGGQREIIGRDSIETFQGVAGHAVYGPYDRLDAGRYVVEFYISPSGSQRVDHDVVCAILDVVIDYGRTVLTSRKVRLKDLAGGRTGFNLDFELGERKTIEYRIATTGVVPLIIDHHRPLASLPDRRGNPAAALLPVRFPRVDHESPAFLIAHEAVFRRLYERGVGVSVQGDDVVLNIRGVSFYVRQWDDFNFIGEIFFKSAYCIKTSAEMCVIDIGMNVGLVSLLIATNDLVKEVHAFEPFRETYDRALANLSLNPTLATRIHTYNVGLSDADEDATIMVPHTDGDSGRASTLKVEGGRPVHLVLKEASAAIGPIIAAARQRGRDVVLKIDCEGGEFAIFRMLDRAGLFEHVTALMVEWHRCFEDRTADELIEPLTRAGFVVFDLSPPTGDGFFYAARVERAKLA